MEQDDGTGAFTANQMAARTPGNYVREPATAELRGECPRRIINVLDAVSMARGLGSRTALVNEILGSWAEKVLHEHHVIERVMGRNPTPPEDDGTSQNRGDQR